MRLDGPGAFGRSWHLPQVFYLRKFDVWAVFGRIFGPRDAPGKSGFAQTCLGSLDGSKTGGLEARPSRFLGGSHINQSWQYYLGFWILGGFFVFSWLVYSA